MWPTLKEWTDLHLAKNRALEHNSLNDYQPRMHSHIGEGFEALTTEHYQLLWFLFFFWLT